eukprot:1160015-Pelagomonas_calceolata.AAC.8
MGRVLTSRHTETPGGVASLPLRAEVHLARHSNLWAGMRICVRSAPLVRSYKLDNDGPYVCKDQVHYYADHVKWKCDGPFMCKEQLQKSVVYWHPGIGHLAPGPCIINDSNKY